MSLSRKDYVAIANVLNTVRTTTQNQEYIISTIARELADHFKADNGAFDRDRFYEACGYPMIRVESP